MWTLIWCFILKYVKLREGNTFCDKLKHGSLGQDFFEKINEGVCEEENYFGVKLKHLMMNFSSDSLFFHKKI
jgi:hypothetical protein